MRALAWLPLSFRFDDRRTSANSGNSNFQADVVKSTANRNDVTYNYLYLFVSVRVHSEGSDHGPIIFSRLLLVHGSEMDDV